MNPGRKPFRGKHDCYVCGRPTDGFICHECPGPGYYDGAKRQPDPKVLAELNSNLNAWRAICKQLGLRVSPQWLKEKALREIGVK